MKKLIYIFIPVLIICFFIHFYTKDNIAFDSEKWKNWNFDENREEFNLRKNMMFSLEWNYDLIGMSKDEIINLIGVPSTDFGFSYSYYLGFGKGVNICNLIIEFDTNQIVKEYFVRES